MRRFFKFIILLEFYSICKNYDLRFSDVNKTSIVTSKFVILNSNGIHNLYAFLMRIESSDKVSVTVSKFCVYFPHIVRSVMGPDVRKHVIGVFDKARLKPACSATETI